MYAVWTHAAMASHAAFGLIRRCNDMFDVVLARRAACDLDWWLSIHLMPLVELAVATESGGLRPIARELLAACDRGESGLCAAFYTRTLTEWFGLERSAALANAGWRGAGAAAWLSVAAQSRRLYEQAEPLVDRLALGEMRRREGRLAERDALFQGSEVELTYDLSEPDHQSPSTLFDGRGRQLPLPLTETQKHLCRLAWAWVHK